MEVMNTHRGMNIPGGGVEMDPDALARLLARCQPRPLGGAFKLAAAFGGTNAASCWADGSPDRDGTTGHASAGSSWLSGLAQREVALP